MSATMEKIEQASITLKANVYFDGKVVSHTLINKEGARQTVGVIYPGSYTFNTDAPERMDIISGNSRVRMAGDIKWATYAAGTMFKVPGKSSFEIAVDAGITEYLCTFE